MKLFGIDLRKPASGELTASAVMAVGLWLAVVGAAHASGHPFARHDAGALLVVVAWGCLGTRLGLRIDAGTRHALAHFGIAAALLVAYQGALAALA